MAPWLGRTALWLALGCALLVGSFALAAGGAIAFGAWRQGGEPNPGQMLVWALIVRGVALQALVPHLLLTGFSWAALVRLLPALDAGWLRLAAGLAALAALWFPLVAGVFFAMWQPTSWVDTANTLWLLAGGVTAALLLSRRLAGRRLAPGALASPIGSTA